MSARMVILEIPPSNRNASLSISNNEQQVSMNFLIDVLRCSDSNSQVVTLMISKHANFSRRAILTNPVENLRVAFISIVTLYK